MKITRTQRSGPGDIINRFYIFLPTSGRSRLLLLLERLKKQLSKKKKKKKKETIYKHLGQTNVSKSSKRNWLSLLVLFRIQFSRTVFSMVSSESSETRDKLKSLFQENFQPYTKSRPPGSQLSPQKNLELIIPSLSPVDKWIRKWTVVDHLGLLTTPFGQTLSARVDLQ